MTVRYRYDRRLVGDQTAKSHLDQIRITESQFADDAAVYTTSHDAFESATTEFVDAASKLAFTRQRGWYRQPHCTYRYLAGAA